MTPTLYTAQHCPHCIRARMALAYAGLPFEVREVDLANLPKEMLVLSPKGTVPVLQLTETEVLEESLDIMHWALLKSDADGWLDYEADVLDAMNDLIRINDNSFANDLLRYVNPERFPEHSRESYRRECEIFLQGLERRLQSSRFLFGDRESFADIAIFPFVYEFSRVELDWFAHSPYSKVRQWLVGHETNHVFWSVMSAYAVWQPGANPVLYQAE
jgi:glutathione S-transferase